jgi:hypothetical protein
VISRDIQRYWGKAWIPSDGLYRHQGHRSVFGECQLRQSLQKPLQVIIIKPAGGYTETPDINPSAGSQGGMVAESPFLEPGGLSGSDRVNPAFLTSVRAFQDGDAGASG